MPSGVSSYGSTTWLAALFGAIALPSSYYIALALDQPGVDSDGDILGALEPPSAAGYTRVSYGTGATNWGVNGDNLTNLLDIDYPSPSDDWGLLTHYVLCNAATSGEIYAFGQFDSPYFAELGVGVLIPAGGIVFRLASLDISIAV